MTPILNRRQTLALGAGAISVAVLGASSDPVLAKNDADEAIKKFTGGKIPVPGKVKLDLPEIAENGNTVPMTVTVDSPMTEQSHVTEILVVANENPRSGVVTFHFSPASGVAEATNAGFSKDCLFTGSRAPPRVSTLPPAPSSTVCPAAVSHSRVRLKRG